MKSLMIVFGALLLLIAIPFAFQAIDDSIAQTTSQSVAGVDTSAGIFAANVTLGRSVYNNDTASVSGVTSNISSDTPTPSSYNSVSRQLEISGLEENADRTLTVSFMIPRVSLAVGAAQMIGLLRWFYIFTIIGFFGGAVYAFFD